MRDVRERNIPDMQGIESASTGACEQHRFSGARKGVLGFGQRLFYDAGRVEVEPELFQGPAVHGENDEAPKRNLRGPVVTRVAPEPKEGEVGHGEG